jgi:hypothetical protein
MEKKVLNMPKMITEFIKQQRQRDGAVKEVTTIQLYLC